MHHKNRHTDIIAFYKVNYKNAGPTASSNQFDQRNAGVNNIAIRAICYRYDMTVKRFSLYLTIQLDNSISGECQEFAQGLGLVALRTAPTPDFGCYK